MKSNVIALILSIWGALLSSIAIGWNIYRDLTKKGKLRVVCYIGNIIDEISGVNETEYLVWNVTNIGQEPIFLTSIGGQTGKEDYFVINPHQPLPIMLKPGEYIIEYTDDLSLINNNLLSLFASDSIGTNYKASKNQLNYLKKKYANKDE